jgi:hypothetical protein
MWAERLSGEEGGKRSASLRKGMSTRSRSCSQLGWCERSVLQSRVMAPSTCILTSKPYDSSIPLTLERGEGGRMKLEERTKSAAIDGLRRVVAKFSLHTTHMICRHGSEG